MTPVWDRLSQGEAILIHDTRDDSLEARVFRATAGDTLDQGYAFIKSCLWVPLIVKDELIGFMSITSDEPGAFNQGHIGMVEAIARQAAVAIENARLYEQARKVAILEERQRLARDLHDAVTQTLFSASLIGDALPKLWERHPQRGEVALEDLRLLTRGALAEMRALLFELRPAALTDAPLPELLRHLADAMAGRTRAVIGFTATDVPVLPPDVQIAFYRIAQEAFNNIEKHAGASRIDLEVHRAGLHGVRLRVRDNGRGFMPTGGRAGHFGMQTMRERAAAIGASLAFQSRPDHGTDITVDWPGEFNQSPTEVQ
jgi:signal transduction histidine kinase